MPFDLEVPAQPLYPICEPFRAPLPGTPETHAQRMARTDQQLELERRHRELLEAVDAALADWRAVRARYDANEAVCKVLGLHAPVPVGDWIVVCNECDYYGQDVADHEEWPCGTFRVIKESL